jgi:hypothetical protein
LYRDSVEKAIGSAAKVQWVPPPVGGRYQGLRITIAPTEAGNRPQAKAPEEKPVAPLLNEEEDENE